MKAKELKLIYNKGSREENLVLYFLSSFTSSLYEKYSS